MLATPLRTQTHPTGQTIKVVVPYPPGGATDVVGRVLAARLGILWKVPLVAETIGSDAAAFNADIAAERAKWGKLINELKIKVE